MVDAPVGVVYNLNHQPTCDGCSCTPVVHAVAVAAHVSCNGAWSERGGCRRSYVAAACSRRVKTSLCRPVWGLNRP